MAKSTIGLIIGTLFGICMLLPFGAIFGGAPIPEFLGIAYMYLMFPLTVLGYIIGGLGHYKGGILIGMVLTIITWAMIGFVIGKLADRTRKHRI